VSSVWKHQLPPFSPVLKVEEDDSSETLISIYQITLRNIPEDRMLIITAVRTLNFYQYPKNIYFDEYEHC
jgi:hypothetical protein